MSRIWKNQQNIRTTLELMRNETSFLPYSKVPDYPPRTMN